MPLGKGSDCPETFPQHALGELASRPREAARLPPRRNPFEISSENGIVIRNQTHWHSIQRDIKTAYGAGT
jgi:hypothetical protein